MTKFKFIFLDFELDLKFELRILNFLCEGLTLFFYCGKYKTVH